MVIIALTATDQIDSRFYKQSKIYVQKQQFLNSKLFLRYDHQLTIPDSGEIEICKDDKSCVSNKLKINKDRSYSEKHLNNAHVYYNKFDTGHKNPLIFVLFFDEANVHKNKYYTRSDFNIKISANETVEITRLQNYENENNLIEDLLKEIDLLDEPVTYNINKIRGDQADGLYNNKKIKIENDTSTGQPKITFPQFTRYKHTFQGGGRGKNACVIFDKDLLMGNNKEELPNIQNKKYDYISVYWSDSVSEPLLLEVNQGGTSKIQNNKYYYHTRDTDGSLIWKQINKGDNVFGVKYDERNEIYSQLVGQPVSKFQDLLNKLRSNLPKIIVFMINKQNEYEITDIQLAFTESNKYKLINQKIAVTDITKFEGNCLSKYGFKVCEHNFNQTAVTIQRTEKAQLKFIVPKNSGTSYSQITLYNNVRTTPQDVEVLDYNSSDKKLYVYFYGDDPRPLLICYPGSAYKPKDTDSYTYTWVKDDNISKCVCEDNIQNNGLLNSLFEAVRILNPVNLYNIGEYLVQNFNKTDIKINVTKTDLTCYYKYEHKYMNSIYTLGSIEYNGNRKKGTLGFDNKKKLDSVTAYYYKQDANRVSPLLVELKVEGDDNKLYYKLSSTNSKYQWTLDSSLNEGNLLDELFKLNKKFNSDKDPKEDDCNPSNSSAIASGVGGTFGTIGLGSAVAGGVLYYKYPEQFLSLITKIIRK